MTTQNKKYLVTYTESNVSRGAAVKLLGVTQANVKEGVSFMAAEKPASKNDVLHFEKLGVSVLEMTKDSAKKLATQKGVLAVEEDVEMFALGMQPEGFDPNYQPEVYINEEEMAKLEGAMKSKQRLTKSKVGKEDTLLDSYEAVDSSLGFEVKNTIEGDKTVPEAEFLPFNHNKLLEKHFSKLSGGSFQEKGLSQAGEGNFHDGYKKAMLDVFSSILDANIKKSTPKADYSTESSDTLENTLAINASFIPWNINMVKAPEAWAKGYDGYGVKVAVLDTGIDKNHPDLWVYGGVNFTSESGGYMDYNGHGTHCAGIIAAREYNGQIVGVAPRAQLYAVKVLGNNGSGSSSRIIAGMEWCVNNGIKVASMSLGGTYAPYQAYINAILRCQQNGVVVVCAAGNSGNDTSFPWVGGPANSAREGWWSTSPIAVGAVDSNNNIALFSSRGQKFLPWNPVGCVAPGVNIRSTYLNNSFATMSGTSMACPHVAGLAALLIQRWSNNVGIYWVKKQLLLGTYFSHPYSASEAKGLGLINCDHVLSTYYLNNNSDFYHKWYLYQ